MKKLFMSVFILGIAWIGGRAVAEEFDPESVLACVRGCNLPSEVNYKGDFYGNYCQACAACEADISDKQSAAGFYCGSRQTSMGMATLNILNSKSCSASGLHSCPTPCDGLCFTAGCLYCNSLGTRNCTYVRAIGCSPICTRCY